MLSSVFLIFQLSILISKCVLAFELIFCLKISQFSFIRSMFVRYDVHVVSKWLWTIHVMLSTYK